MAYKIGKMLFTIVGILALIGVGMNIEGGRHPSAVSAAPVSTFAPVSCDQFVAVSSASSVQVIAAGNASMFTYICAYGFGSIGGSTFSIVEGTGSTCATNIKAMAGGTTAAAGFGIAANALINEGSGVGTILKTQVAGDNVCLITAGTGPLAGSIAYTTANF